jgi:hypothetical protein
MNYSRAALASILSIIILPSISFAAALPHVNLPTPSTACINGVPQITLKWSPVSGATSYSVFRNAASTSWLNVSSKQTTTTLADKNTSGISYQYQVKAFFPTGVTYSNIVTATAPNCALAATSNETSFTAYITGYGWPDNTPPSAEISNPVIHKSAGGAGTYTDPITIAVGHSIISGKDILDYPQGTKFYIPALRRYFIVEDTCGDGGAPQNGPCHTGYKGYAWLDAWVGGQNQNSSSVLSCEDSITALHKIIKNPASNYAVVPGPIFGGSCSSLYSETPVAI